MMSDQAFRIVLFLVTVTFCSGRVRHGRNQRSGFTGNIVELTEEDRLIKHIIKRYEYRGTYSRPLEKFKDKIEVEFGLQLIQIVELDEKEQILTINVWVDHSWKDMYLTWNESEYKGVKEVHLPHSKIWTPDIKLYNYADERLREYRDALCVVNSSGVVTWLPQAVFKSQCDIDVETYPFDKQSCTLKFGSWTYNGLQLDLQFKSGPAFTMDDFTPSNVWEVVAVPAVRNEKNYSCCPYPFIDLTFQLVIRRRATFYANILILPCVLLTSLTLVLFFIPPESPAKMMLGMSIFMAFFILMLLFEANIPPAIKNIPILGTYYCLNMVLITLSSFLNVFVVNMTFYGARAQAPYALKKVMFSCIARMLCMQNLVLPFTTDGPLPSKLQYNGVNSNHNRPSDFKGSRECLLSDLTDITENHSQLANIRNVLEEIRFFIKSYKEKIEEKDKKEKVAREWKALALVFDRIFFLLYLATIVGSFSFVIPLISNS